MNMRATTWMCPILVLCCTSGLVCSAQRGYPLDYATSNRIQDNYMLDKRNKPSLSIVNPLDVLRQRLLLEIARRQMKENTRQVELNRAILKNVGKRMSASGVARRYQLLLQHLDQRQFPEVDLTGAYPYVWLDAEEQEAPDNRSSNGGNANNGNDLGNDTNQERAEIEGNNISDNEGNNNNNNREYQSHYEYQLRKNPFAKE